jgi:hypothetical protein
LSKNGFDLTLDSSLMNNMGTAEELGYRVLEGTDWAIESEKILQTQDEALVMLTLPPLVATDDSENKKITDYKIYKIKDDDETLISDGAIGEELT